MVGKLRDVTPQLLRVARRLDRAGHKVAAIYHGNVAAAETFEHETGIKTYMWDVADFMACEAGVGAVTSDFAMPVAIVINNAGITRDAMLHKISFTQWADVIATDLTSCFNMCRAVIASMREHGFGRIVNISSINGQKGQFGQTNYAAAKAGVLGFTKALALETAAKGITVNAVAPGYVETEMLGAISKEILGQIEAQIPIGRLGQPDEIARLIEFLVREEAGFITGTTMAVNGGQFMA
jgi:acetoacetyl-CoA reductase